MCIKILHLIKEKLQRFDEISTAYQDVVLGIIDDNVGIENWTKDIRIV